MKIGKISQENKAQIQKIHSAGCCCECTHRYLWAQVHAGQLPHSISDKPQWAFRNTCFKLIVQSQFEFYYIFSEIIGSQIKIFKVNLNLHFLCSNLMKVNLNFRYKDNEMVACLSYILHRVSNKRDTVNQKRCAEKFVSLG